MSEFAPNLTIRGTVSDVESDDIYYDAVQIPEAVDETINLSSESDSDVANRAFIEDPAAVMPAAGPILELEFDDEYSNLLDIPCVLCDELVAFGKGTTIPGCGHSMCPNCVAKAILQEQTLCPVADGRGKCVAQIPTGLIRHVLPAVEFEQYQIQSMEALDDVDLVLNTSQFECSICLCQIEPGFGVVLRDCVHEFCFECIRQQVKHCEDAQVICPFKDHEYSCEAYLQQREVRGVLADQADYNRHLSLCLRVAERRLSNTFHCTTRDCIGFCVREEGQLVFLCPVCKQTNCTVCEVIHDNVTCKQYQDWKRSQTGIGLHEYSSKMLLQNLVAAGEAMLCPKCKAVVVKIAGCDALVCTMCKTALCWATKGARWGPAGAGDISGGCRCNVNGRRCHVKCINCH